MGLEVTDRAVSANLRPLDGLKSGTFFLAMALLVFAPPFAPYAALFAQDAEEPAEEAAPAEEEAAPAEEAPAQEPGTAADAGGSSADVQSLLEEGLKLYQEGNYSGAAEKFERAFALNPSREDILRFVDKAGVASIFAMVRNPDPKIAGIALQVLQLTHTGAKAKSENEAEIAAAVRSVLAAKGQDQMVLMLRHTGTHGKNLVPALVPHLGDSDLSRRGAAINWIPKIGLDAVPILQAARKHPNPIVRRNIAYLLGRGHLRHHVSLGTLKAMMETDEAGEVKAAAEQSFETIIGELDGRGAVREAKEYFTANGGEYYLRPHRNPFAKSFYTPKVYTLVGQRIVAEPVAEFQFSERMAKQALEEALELDPAFLPARVLGLCNDCAQVVEYDLNQEYYSKNDSHPELKSLLESQKPYVDYVLRLRLLAAPSEVLSGGLARALDDGRPEVARQIVETMHATHRGVTPSLVSALKSADSRLLRVAAAIAIAHAPPSSRTEAGEDVISALTDAVLASGIRTVQRVMGNGRLANRFGEVLRGLDVESYTPIGTVERGYNEAVSSPPDLILMDENVNTRAENQEVGAVNYFITLLRRNYRTVNVPVVVVVPEARLAKAQELYGSEERKVWIVADTVDGLGLKNSILDKAFGELDDAKTRATRLASSAAEALAHLAARPSRLPVRGSIPALIRVLHNRPDSVRLPCIRALGDLRAAEATGELAQVFSAASNSVEVRVAAMTAIGKALAAAEASRAVMTAVLAGMQEQNLDLRRASWYAFANSGAEPALHFEKAILALPPAAPEAPAAPGEAPGEAPKAAKPPAEPGAEPAEPDAEAPTPEETPAEEPEAEAGAEGTETEGAGTEGAGTEAEEGTSGR